jgi:hypothetical protein
MCSFLRFSSVCWLWLPCTKADTTNDYEDGPTHMRTPAPARTLKAPDEYGAYISRVSHACYMPAYLILFALITSIMRSELHTLWSRSHCQFILRCAECCHSNTPMWVRIPSRNGMLFLYVAIGLAVQELQGFQKTKKGRPWSALAFVPYKKRKLCSFLLHSCISNWLCFRQYDFYVGTLSADYLIHVSAFRPLSGMQIDYWLYC